jgi:hypothetical protein
MAKIKSGTLVGSAVTTVTLDQAYTQVQVLNRSGTAEIFFTVDDGVPTVGGDNCFCVAAAIGASMTVGVPDDENTTVQLISTGTPTYTVAATQG